MGFENEVETIYWAALPSDERQVQRTLRTHLIHRPARDIMPPRGGTRVSPIRFDYVRLSRCNSVLAPAELGAIDCQKTYRKPRAYASSHQNGDV
jgi:hypothetical protein